VPNRFVATGGRMRGGTVSSAASAVKLAYTQLVIAGDGTRSSFCIPG